MESTTCINRSKIIPLDVVVFLEPSSFPGRVSLHMQYVVEADDL